MSVLVIGENNNNQLADVTLELIGAGAELAKKLNESLDVLVLGDNVPEIVGVDNIYVVQNECLKSYSTELYSHAACEVIKQKKPSVVLVGATTQGRDLAPRISTRLNTGLTADCTLLDINEKGMLAATRPTFGGSLMATILCKTHPQMATVRPRVFPKVELEQKNTITEKIEVDFSNVELKTKLLELVEHLNSSEINIEDAEIIVAGGRGLKGAEGFEVLETLAKTLGGAVGASRAAVDAGWVSHSIQIGQTGKTVSPKIYIACGISGAIQHMAGISTNSTLIAINKDADAPIFQNANYGLVGDLFEIVPELTKTLKEDKKELVSNT